MNLYKKLYWFCHSMKWKFISLDNIIKSRLNALKWKLCLLKNKTYWFLYKKEWFPYCDSVYKNFQYYLRPLVNALTNWLCGKKTVVVFLLVKSHYGWVKEVLQKLASRRVAIQIYSPVEGLSVDPKIGKVYPMNCVQPVRGINFVPALLADLFITPASTTADNAPLGSPKLMMMHSLVSIPGVYEENTFDGYDYIYCAGKHHLEEIKALYLKKGLKGKCLIPGGYPKLDELMLRSTNLAPVTHKTVIIAPTLVSLATERVSLINHVEAFVDYFLINGWAVKFRPHPLNLDRANEFYFKLSEVIEKYKTNKKFMLDTSSDYFSSYASSSVMLSDVSGTAFTYAFAFGRPVLFFDPEVSSEFTQGLLYKNRIRMGRTVRSVGDLHGCINDFLGDYDVLRSSVESFRDDIIFNLGSSARYFSENLDYILNGKKHSDWTYV